MKLSRGEMPDSVSVLSLHESLENQNGHADHVVSAPHLEDLGLYHITFSQGDDVDLLGITQSCLFDALSTRDAPWGRLVMKRCKIDGSGRFGMVRLWDGVIQSSK